VYIQIVSIDNVAYAAIVELILVDGLKGALPDILSEIISALPLPEFNVGSIDPGIPPTVWRFENVTIDRQGHYHVLAGGLE
jgi:hypothetical protein